MMRVEKFSKEIVKVGEKLIALSTIYAIEGCFLVGMRGYGDMHWAFTIKTALGNDGEVKIIGERIDYSRVDSMEYRYVREEEHPIYVDKKIELLTVRDELVLLWSQYLEENK